MGSVIPRQVYLGSETAEQSRRSKHAGFSMVAASAAAVIINFLQSSVVTRMHKPNNFFFLQVALGHDICHSNRELD